MQDFNLEPETRSIKMLENGMKNLIKEFGIKFTHNKELCPDDNISDYVIISEGIDVKKFKVPEVFVSDHLPLILEFS